MGQAPIKGHNLCEQLGVSDERAEELRLELQDFHRDLDTTSEVLKKIVETGKTPSEIALQAFVYGRHVQEMLEMHQ